MRGQGWMDLFAVRFQEKLNSWTPSDMIQQCLQSNPCIAGMPGQRLLQHSSMDLKDIKHSSKQQNQAQQGLEGLR